MSTPRVLVVDDDAAIREALTALLSAQGYEVYAASDGQQALAEHGQHRPDLVLLDVLMPGLSGMEVCRRIRERDLDVPVLMVTAKAEEADRVLGLELGADDYIVKPFGGQELLARVHAALRRSARQAQGLQTVTYEGLTIDFARRRVQQEDRPVILTATEFDLLAYLYGHRGVAVDRMELLREVWRYEHSERLDTRTVENHVHRLRFKIEPDPSRPRYVRTVRGHGYVFGGSA